ncbi:hypothetical protein A9Q99_03180 [Gammaproteobacteria bacterium 45_16_T64]|nr:hypothetical protein A9Q99_03180 [Gammaproteobacteria bacterium 45_16_T64]
MKYVLSKRSKLVFFYLSFFVFIPTAFSNSTPNDLLLDEQWAIRNFPASTATCESKPDIYQDILTGEFGYFCTEYTSPNIEGIHLNAELGWGLFQPLPLVGNELPDVVIGLIDSGIDYLHPDLADHIWINPGETMGNLNDLDSNGIIDTCEDAIDNDNNGYIDDCHGINANVEKDINGQPNPLAGDPLDTNAGHGTNMAGVIAATGNNQTEDFHGGVVGIAGLASNVKIATCSAAKVVNDVYVTIPGAQGFVSTAEAVTACLDYFADLKDNGINIAAINGSGGASAFDNFIITRAKVREDYLLNTPEVSQAIQRLGALDIPVIVAAGNHQWSLDHDPETAYYPASFDLPNIISVAAIDNQGALWSNSSFGRWTVDVAAPGSRIASTSPRVEITGNVSTADYVVSSGSSQATAYVSGIVGLLRANNDTHELTTAQIKRLLLSSGKTLESLKQITRSGQLVQLAGEQGQGVMTCDNRIYQRRQHPQYDNLFRIPGEVIYIEVHKYNCSEPSNDSTLTVSVSPTGEQIDLFDDGLAPDALANDGIYSGEWVVPSEIQDYQLSLGVDSATQALDIIDISAKIIVDNADSNTQRKGWWWPSTYRNDYYAHNYRYAPKSSSSERTYKWKPEVPTVGYYNVYTRNPAHGNFATNANVTVHHQTEGNTNTISTSHSVDQTQLPGQWKLLGRYWFTEGEQVIELSNLNADSTVIADAVMLQFSPSAP